MKFKMQNFLIALFLIPTLSTIFWACSEDDPENAADGQLNVKITDAAVDRAEVQGVIVTVSEIRVGGEPLAGFEGKSTFDLMAYQNGDALLLGSGDMAAGTYGEIELILDLNEDADGNSPGCYVLTSEGKMDLSGSVQGTHAIHVDGEVNIEPSSERDIVIDFNLRKAVSYDDAEATYQLVAGGALNSSLRLVDEEMAGSVSGQIEGEIGADERVIVYAYTKGDFSESETSANADGMLFTNAVNSGKVDNDGNYMLAFLHEGEYELHFARYEETEEGGSSTITFEGMLEASAVSGPLLNNVSVEANANTTIDIILEGLLL